MPQYIGLATIGRDAEVRHTAQGDAVASVSLAFSYGKKGQDGRRPTQWVEGSLWGQRAESLQPYLIKGTRVYVVIDEAHQEDYQTRDGRSGSKIAGRVSVIEFAGKPAQAQQAPAQAAPQPATRSSSNLADMEDDIPF